MEAFFIKTFWITVIMLWIALVILYIILTNRKSLERKGHQEKYIAYLRKSHLIRICLIAVLMPLLILISAWIIYKITGKLEEEVQLAYIVLVLIALVVPFKYIDERINQKRIRELALETKEKIAVDLNYKALHLIFNPVWELILAPLALSYGILFLRIEQWIVYLFLIIPWLMYLNIRGTRYQTRPYLKDNYKYIFTFNIFNFLFFLAYFCAYYLIRLQDFTPGEPSIWLLLAGGLIILGLVSRIALYLANFKAFNRSISESSERMQASNTRKLVFVAGGVFLLLALSGVSVATGLLHKSQMEVGVVKQKYLIHAYRGSNDTLLLVDNDHRGSFLDYQAGDFPGELRRECKVTLSTSHRTKTYQVCCPGEFEDLPIGITVKFEYAKGRTITGLVDD
jgi:ABC-type multidrug transport system fused ATPase/permease subunit